MRISSGLKLIVTAVFISLAALNASGAAAETVAVVDVARVIDASVPGKAGQRYMDGVKAGLDAEFEKYKKSLGAVKDGDARLAQKQAELAARYQAEFSRVTGRLLAELRRETADWLKGNKRDAAVVIPASAALAVSPAADVSAEIQRRLDALSIDFAKK